MDYIKQHLPPHGIFHMLIYISQIGRWKRITGVTKMVPVKQPRFKKAFVTFERGAMIM